MFKNALKIIFSNFWKLAGFYVWVVCFLKIIGKRDIGIMVDIADWLVVLVGGALFAGGIFIWSGAVDEFKG